MMSIILSVKRSFLAMSFALPLPTAFPAQAQGDGPLSTCLERSGREAEALKACLIQHQEELRALYDLPADWATRVLAHLRSHPEAWDRLEDVVDRLEDTQVRAENVRDRHEDRLGTREDRRDDRVDLEDVFDRREDWLETREDRHGDTVDLEDVFDRREDVRDRIENRWDRRH
ncbi:MAG: hypothetical protein MUO35_08840 [Anaerolineales bacterium]|nr:hypothetical protein [Anaerolineales bacterium]